MTAAGDPAKRGSGGWVRLFVGSLNRESPYFQGARGKGIAVFAFDQETGAFSHLSNTTDIDNPTYLVASEESRTLYAVSEVYGWKEGTVSAYRFDLRSESLVYLNKQPTLGSLPAHLSLRNDGGQVFVANYAMAERGGPDQSVAVFDVRPDGGLTPAVSSVAHVGSSINPARQSRPHAHCIMPFGDTDIVLVTDLGVDTLFAYRVGNGGELREVGRYTFEPGAGPRHIATDPASRRVFVINELNSTIAVLELSATGSFEWLDEISAAPATPAARHHCAHIIATPDGRFLYSTDRARNIVSAFRVDSTGKLQAIGHEPSGGITPRHFAVSPNGRYLLVANQNSDNIAIFLRDEEAGSLRDTGARIAVGTPMCVAFADIP
ncbi:MAG: lactonase family protein [Acetobacteraceae bacterium]